MSEKLVFCPSIKGTCVKDDCVAYCPEDKEFIGKLLNGEEMFVIRKDWCRLHKKSVVIKASNDIEGFEDI